MGQIPQHRVAFPHALVCVYLKKRHHTQRVYFQECMGFLFALQDVDQDQVKRLTQLVQREPRFITVARAQTGVKFHHGAILL